MQEAISGMVVESTRWIRRLNLPAKRLRPAPPTKPGTTRPGVQRRPRRVSRPSRPDALCPHGKGCCGWAAWMVDDWTVSPVTVGGNTGVTVTVAENVPAVSLVRFGVRVSVPWDWLIRIQGTEDAAVN